ADKPLPPSPGNELEFTSSAPPVTAVVVPLSRQNISACRTLEKIMAKAGGPCRFFSSLHSGGKSGRHLFRRIRKNSIAPYRRSACASGAAPDRSGCRQMDCRD